MDSERYLRADCDDGVGFSLRASLSISGRATPLGYPIFHGSVALEVGGSGGSGLSITVASSGVTAGTVYALSSFGSWISVANTSANAIRLLAVATGSSSNNGMLTHGVFRKASHGYQIGSPLYLSSTSGTFTTTVPTATNSYARVLGYAISSDDIYFCPDNTWVKNN